MINDMLGDTSLLATSNLSLKNEVNNLANGYHNSGINWTHFRWYLWDLSVNKFKRL